jgi:hypothetical protein
MGHDRQTLTALAAALAMSAAAAQPVLPEGEKSLVAVTRDGQKTRIGAVTFRAVEGGKSSFRVQMDHAVMRDYFLSMREFKCLPAAAEVSCFVPYPYRQPGTIAPGDMAWLEHSLLFLIKQPADFGAKLWNGVIFKLSLTPNGIVGKPQAVDLNAISAPPDQLDTPPFGPNERTDFAPGARWVQELRIE